MAMATVSGDAADADSAAGGHGEAEPQLVSVVIPAYNEAKNLAPLVRETADALADGPGEGYEIIIVDDGSTDETHEKGSHLAQLYDQVTFIELSRNFGQSPALSAGIDAAHGDVIVPMDGDGQNDPADIPALVGRLMDGYDCVSGYRRDRNDPLAKRIPSGIQTRLAKLTGPDINDFGCTLTAYRSAALADVDLYGEEHRYIPSQLYHNGFRIDEMEVNHRPREHGQSRYGAGRLVRGFSDLAFHLLWNRYSTRPMHLFGGAGFLAMALGLLVGSYFVGAKYLTGAALAPNLPQLLLSVGLVLSGMVVVLFGIVIQFLTRIHYSDRPEYRIERVTK